MPGRAGSRMQIIPFFASSPCESTLARRYVLAAEDERHALDRSGQLRRDLAARSRICSRFSSRHFGQADGDGPCAGACALGLAVADNQGSCDRYFRQPASARTSAGLCSPSARGTPRRERGRTRRHGRGGGIGESGHDGLHSPAEGRGGPWLASSPDRVHDGGDPEFGSGSRSRSRGIVRPRMRRRHGRRSRRRRRRRRRRRSRRRRWGRSRRRRWRRSRGRRSRRSRRRRRSRSRSRSTRQFRLNGVQLRWSW